ncbi:cytochrome P450 [Salix suchowensis]|nr:cytochrome P450 [Salix suchowensis]
MNSILKLLNDFISSESTREYAKKEFNAILWVALITITSVLLDKVFKLFRLWSKASKIPGPPCNSFFGHGNLGSRENFIDLLWESHDKYGSVFKLWLGPTQLLVSMKDPTLIKDMLLKAGDKLPSLGRHFDWPLDDQAQKGRESLAMELDDKLLGKANVISKNVVNSIMQGVDASMSIGSVDCKLISQHMAFTILGTSLFGDTFLAWSKATFYEELLMMIAKDASFGHCQQCGKNHKLSCHMDRNSHIGTAKDKFFSQELGGDINAREEPCGNIMGLMFHGCIATTSLIGRNALLLATIYESARLLPAGPLLQRCSLKDDLILKNGMLIPAGALLVVPAQLLQMDGSSWGSDASKFNPYRFLSKAVKGSDSVHDTSSTVSLVLNDPNDNAAFLPFGSGMRTCVGQKFVSVELPLCLLHCLNTMRSVRLHPQLGNGSKSTAGPEIVFARRSR